MSEVSLTTEHAVCGPDEVPARQLADARPHPDGVPARRLADARPHPGCTGVSSLLGEPMLGTAPHATAWLLLVHPGPWPAGAPNSLLDSVVADELARLCTQHRVRMAAIRRPATSPEPALHACYVASTRSTDAWIERVPLAEPKDLLDLDIEAIAHGVAPSVGQRVTGPFYAVCMHGKRDACCAAHGRPVQRTLERLAPGRVWETTHLGGHRFAANVLVLPEGVMYGRVDQADVPPLVDTHARGAIIPALWRGRTAHPQAAQAAEWFARRAMGLLAIDAIAIKRVDGNEDLAAVSLQAGARSMTVVVERVATGCTRITGCAGDATDPGRWRMVSMA